MDFLYFFLLSLKMVLGRCWVMKEKGPRLRWCGIGGGKYYCMYFSLLLCMGIGLITGLSRDNYFIVEFYLLVI